MKYAIDSPKHIDAEIALPSSKSISNRVLIINALSNAPSVINSLAECDDTDAMQRALLSVPADVNIGAAGTAMRFLTAYYALCAPQPIIIDGSERMRQRPIGILVEALRKCGANIEYAGKEGYPPLRIIGTRLKGGNITLSGNVSSQYISALLMIAPYMWGGLTITLTGEIISRPYILMTLNIMQQFGVQSLFVGNTITVPQCGYVTVPITVESDWSAASYWYEMAALLPGSRVMLRGLIKDSVQGDSVVSKIYEKLGVDTIYLNSGVCLNSNGKKTDRLETDLTDSPDLAQTIVTTCALMGVQFRISGLQSLKIKETDRIAALINELHKLGYVIKEVGDGILQYDGERCNKDADAVITTYDDHRMAMAFAPASVVYPGIKIDHPEVVSKSYPYYWQNIEQAGFTISKEE